MRQPRASVMSIHVLRHQTYTICMRKCGSMALRSLAVIGRAFRRWHRMMKQTFDRPKIDWQRREQPSSVGISLLPLRRSGARARWRLYCLPYAGASAGIFRSWLELLPPDIDIWGVEYPGHGTRISEPLIDRIERLAEPLADAVAAETGMPYAFFGHSMGSLVAFEICHKLTERRT